MKYINFHTHKTTLSTHEFAIQNTYPNLGLTSAPFSVGIHPWYLSNKTLEEDYIYLQNKVQHKNCIAIGECGIDKKINTNISFQIEVFKEHVKLSEQYKKPLIIHCVKAFQEIIALKKQLNPKQTWVIHGYNKNHQLAKSILKNGILLSFGATLLNKQKLQDIVTELNVNQFFLETDDATINIEEIYKKVASLKNMKLQILKEEIQKNLKQILQK